MEIKLQDIFNNNKTIKKALIGCFCCAFLCSCTVVDGLSGLGGISQNANLSSSPSLASSDKKYTGFSSSKNVGASSAADMAIVYFVKGDFETAEHYIRAALTADPNEPYALLIGGIIYEQLGRPNRARQHYEDLMIMNAAEPSVLSNFKLTMPTPISDTARERMKMLEVRQSAFVIQDPEDGTPQFNVIEKQNQNTSPRGTINNPIPINGAQVQNGGLIPISPNNGYLPPIPNINQGQNQYNALASGRTPGSNNANLENRLTQDRFVSSDLDPALFNNSERNMIMRFQAFKDLAEEGLITKEEFFMRRQANIGALLPQTHAPPSAGLDRPVPSPEVIVERLKALRKGFELRSISAREHAAERSLILDALLPVEPKIRAEAPPPPQGLMEAAKYVRKLEVLRSLGLITKEELSKEKKVVEKLIKLSSNDENSVSDSISPSNKGSRSLGPRVLVPGLTAPSATQKTTNVKKKPKKVTKNGGYGVQVGSYRKKTNANRGWQRILAKFSDLLSLSEAKIYEANIGGDTFYRLVITSVGTLSDAKRLAGKLKARGQGAMPYKL